MSNKLIKTFDQYVTSQKIAIAVSGGIDSMVLMKVSSLSKKIKPKNIHILTINHDLRKGSKEETLFVRNALNEDLFRYDASELMERRIGADHLLYALKKYISLGSEFINEITEELDSKY